MTPVGTLLSLTCQGCGESFEWVRQACCTPKWCSERCRRAQYEGTCSTCGKPTNGSHGRASTFCRSCREWPEEAIVAAMREWFDRYGAPPTVTQWRKAASNHPSSATITQYHGWNRMLIKAGLPLACDRSPETQAAIERLVREEVPTREIADRFGCTPANISNRLRSRGTSITQLREAA